MSQIRFASRAGRGLVKPEERRPRNRQRLGWSANRGTCSYRRLCNRIARRGLGRRVAGFIRPRRPWNRGGQQRCATHPAKSVRPRILVSTPAAAQSELLMHIAYDIPRTRCTMRTVGGGTQKMTAVISRRKLMLNLCAACGHTCGTRTQEKPTRPKASGFWARGQGTQGNGSPPNSSWLVFVRVSIHDARNVVPFHELPL